MADIIPLNPEFAKDVWAKLSQLDVNEHVEKKGKFNYLSWTWAWRTLMENYPCSNYRLRKYENHTDGSATVWVDLTVSDGKNSMERTMWLPVLDFKNKAIKNPSAFEIQNSRMRCLVKAMGMFGLGFYLYAGEDLPYSPYTGEQLDTFKAFIASKDGDSMYVWMRGLSEPEFSGLWATIEASPGERDKGKNNADIDEIYKPSEAAIVQIIKDLDDSIGDADRTKGLLEDCRESYSGDVIKYIYQTTRKPTQQFIDGVK